MAALSSYANLNFDCIFFAVVFLSSVCGMSLAGRQLSFALMGHPTLEQLNLSSNEIRDSGVMSLAHFISESAFALTELDLSSNLWVLTPVSHALPFPEFFGCFCCRLLSFVSYYPALFCLVYPILLLSLLFFLSRTPSLLVSSSIVCFFLPHLAFGISPFPRTCFLVIICCLFFVSALKMMVQSPCPYRFASSVIEFGNRPVLFPPCRHLRVFHLERLCCQSPSVSHLHHLLELFLHLFLSPLPPPLPCCLPALLAARTPVLRFLLPLLPPFLVHLFSSQRCLLRLSALQTLRVPLLLPCLFMHQLILLSVLLLRWIILQYALYCI